MIAFGMAGADDLSAITAQNRPQAKGDPNWPLLLRTYETIGVLSLATAALTAISGLAMGAFSLNGILREHPDPTRIWIALFIYLGGQFVVTYLSRDAMFLHGMGKVALSNRWTTMLSLASTLSGFITLSLGGDIVGLTIVMQSALIIGMLNIKRILKKETTEKLNSSKLMACDQKILKWAWPAFWKGLITTLCNRGLIQFSAVFYTRYSSPLEASSFLFSFNLLQTVIQFSEAPLSAHAPKFSRLLAKGEYDRLNREFPKNLEKSQWLLTAGIIILGLAVPTALSFLNSNTSFLSPLPWALLTLGIMSQRFLLNGMRLPALGNTIILYKTSLISSAISLALTPLAIIHYGIYGLIAAVYVPSLVAINIRPYSYTASLLEGSTPELVKRSGLWALISLLAAHAVLVLARA
ncbi:hypothetical protein [Pelagicoccus sp. SDUM812005]|uniref:hypothetical protein n=1 Tax=Pelagicoccus sp. SDUM812005 TaxID=3041257 RepID=UPI0028125941|nr:hypothetical protein [Pelagicoccus sp. SDUM812005]